MPFGNFFTQIMKSFKKKIFFAFLVILLWHPALIYAGSEDSKYIVPVRSFISHLRDYSEKDYHIVEDVFGRAGLYRMTGLYPPETSDADYEKALEDLWRWMSEHREEILPDSFRSGRLVYNLMYKENNSGDIESQPGFVVVYSMTQVHFDALFFTVIRVQHEGKEESEYYVMPEFYHNNETVKVYE
jgi:hypothetical protein